MNNKLQLTIAQYTNKGFKKINQDFNNYLIPNDYLLKYKGIAIALADGISSSDVSQIASKISVNSFLEDYYCTAESWGVKKSASRVLTATNTWLYSQSKQSQYKYNLNKGYVCTFSSLIIKSNRAHIFHIGDSRIYRIRDKQLEQITKDHRIYISKEENYLSRALGIDSQLTIDYELLDINKNDIFILATDGVYEYFEKDSLFYILDFYKNDYDKAAKILVEEALKKGSKDNLTIQLVRVENLPQKELKEINDILKQKPLPSILEARDEFDGFTIIRTLSSSPRSHVYLAKDKESKKIIVLKIPSTELKDDKAYLERFMLEDWIAKKINNAYVLKSFLQARKQNYLYNVSEYIQGQTLSQWLIDNPKPKLEKIREIVEQIAKGLYAFHSLEMVHQDLRPENILIDENDTIKIIDFGAVKVEGLLDISSKIQQENLQGTALYSAPEYFLGLEGNTQADIFSLAVITYQMLSGKFPYGTNIAKTQSKKQQRRLKYNFLYEEGGKIPLWIDETLRKALEIEPKNRYFYLSEFIYDLKNPNEKYLKKKTTLIEKNPLVFWQFLSVILFFMLLAQWLKYN